MAEEKKSSGADESMFSQYGVFIIIAVILMIMAVSSGQGIFYLTDPESKKVVTPEKPARDFSFSISKFVGQGEIDLGKKIISVGETQVRRSPGGEILGIQKKLNEGKIMEGPVDQFGTFWWRINFEEAPSGWVENNSISSKNKIVKLVNFPITLYRGFKPIGWFLSVFLLLVAFYFRLKLVNENKILDKKRQVQDEVVEKREKEKVDSTRDDLGLPVGDQFKNQRWEHVKELMKSGVQSDWRQAIIEADIILDEMLRRMSYDGLTIGDMLKQIEPSDFANLDKAWEAHKFRNEIAHTGSEFVLSKDEAERIIRLFQDVFDEFYFV